jgi:hypothetical protein
LDINEDQEIKNLSKIVLGVLAIGLTCCCQPSPHPSTFCADFSNRAPNTTPPSNPFTEANFLEFRQQPPGSWIYLEEAGEIGLRFGEPGLEITLQAPKNHITMRFGTFSLPVKLTAYDGAASVYTQTINTANTYQNFTINTPTPFARLVLKGGKDEAILVRICVN